MRLLLSRLAPAGALLAMAAALTQSAPARNTLVAQSASVVDVPQVRPISDAPRREDRPSVPAASTPPVTVAAAARPAAAKPVTAAKSSGRVAVGTGQWGLINQDRAAAGLAPLQWSPCLAEVATQNARRMAAQGYISHANGRTQDLACHLGSRTGENIGYVGGGPNDVMMNTWFMGDAPHRANILGPYHYVGSAWVIAANGTAYLAVEFG
jgi:uncharacterized protein YkwD